MSSTTCPRCKAPASGNFCSACGSSLGVANCPSCGATPERGARFCNKCGASVGAAPAAAAAPARTTAGSKLGWWLAGAFMVAMILVLAYPVLRDTGAPPQAPTQAPGGTGATGGAGAVDLSSMTPRQAADRLFERVMAADEAGDQAEVATFIPMAMDAYDGARPLDADGLFHLSLLQRTADDYEAALATALEALEDSPDHLLNLAAAAEAALEMDDEAAARDYYARFLEAYDAEMAKGLPEYAAHGRILPTFLESAREITGG